MEEKDRMLEAVSCRREAALPFYCAVSVVVVVKNRLFFIVK
jgi:hypothetical protein